MSPPSCSPTAAHDEQGSAAAVEEVAPRVFLVDDDVPFMSGLERMLRATGYRAMCFDSAADFLARRPASSPGCVVADLQMPDMDGMALQQALAHSDDPVPVVFLTGNGDIPTGVAAMRHGAEDFLAKTAPREQLLAAIERALVRNSRERRERARRRELQGRVSTLTVRELEVMAHVLRGRLNKQIAADLGIDERTVKRHRANMMVKLGIASVAALAQLAVEAGIVDRDVQISTK